MKRLSILLLLSIAGVLAWATYTTENDQQIEITNAKIITEKIVINGPVVLDLPSVRIPKSVKEPGAPSIREFKVQYGDTFNNILQSIKLPDPLIEGITVQLNNLLKPNEFQVGIPYQIKYQNSPGHPVQLIFRDDIKNPIVINFETGSVQRIEADIKTQIRSFGATISSSLAESIINANIPNDLSDKVLSIFAWKIDFNHLSKGDTYRLIFEEESIDGEIIGSGHVLAAYFIHDGIEFRGYGFDNGNEFSYYDENGMNLSHAPLHFELITSLYDRHRLHPVRRTYRPHLGMDFEAQKGTSVVAIRGGVVLEARYGRANGNFVKIKHDESLSTQYLHLSVIDSNIKVGEKVLQGQKIGEVGTTGLSSGPHLCFRVWYKGHQEDPLEFDFPRQADINGDYLHQFKEMVKLYDQEIMDKEFL